MLIFADGRDGKRGNLYRQCVLNLNLCIDTQSVTVIICLKLCQIDFGCIDIVYMYMYVWEYTYGCGAKWGGKCFEV